MPFFSVSCFHKSGFSSLQFNWYCINYFGLLRVANFRSFLIFVHVLSIFSLLAFPPSVCLYHIFILLPYNSNLIVSFYILTFFFILFFFSHFLPLLKHFQFFFFLLIVYWYRTYFFSSSVWYFLPSLTSDFCHNSCRTISWVTYLRSLKGNFILIICCFVCFSWLWRMPRISCSTCQTSPGSFVNSE